MISVTKNHKLLFFKSAFFIKFMHRMFVLYCFTMLEMLHFCLYSCSGFLCINCVNSLRETALVWTVHCDTKYLPADLVVLSLEMIGNKNS